MAKLSPKVRISEDIIEFIVERNPTNARSVAKPLLLTQVLESITEFTLERSPTSVHSAAKPSAVAHTSLYTGEFIPERNPTHAKPVQSLFHMFSP